MKFGPISFGDKNKDKAKRKKTKLSREAVELQLMAELDIIAGRYQNTIISETAKLKERRKNGKSEERCVARICDAFYGLLVIKEAKEELGEIHSTSELCTSMNRMGTALKVLNRLDASAESPHSFTIRRQIGKLRRSAENDEKKLTEVYKDLDDYVPSNLIDRLVRGDSVYDCLQGESLPQDNDISRMFDSILDGITDEPINDTIVEGNISSISDLIDGLSDD